ncbi:MAG: LysR family transcriptional regulator [Nannocystaceae bacterium]
MHPLSRVNLNLLVALAALLDEQNVTRAAERLGVTQSAMSHTLRQLRELVGDPILVRGGRGMVLTPRAQALRAPLTLGLGELSRVIEGSLSWDPARASRRFRVAAGDYIGVRVLPPLIEVITREAPGVDLVVRPVEPRSAAVDLESGAIDVIITLTLDPAPGLRRRALLGDDFACLARRDHPEIRGDLDLDTYCRLAHVLISLDGDGESVVDRALAALGRRRRVALRVPYFLAAPMVVARSDYILTAPANLCREFAEHFPLQVLRAPVVLPGFTLSQIWHERFDEDPAHRWLRERLAAVGAALAAADEVARGRGARRRPRARG